MTPTSLAGSGMAALLALALPALASAQGAITAHKLSLSLKAVTQGYSSSMDARPDKFTAKERDLFDHCLGRPPARDEGVYLFFDCADFDSDQTSEARILAVDTAPYLGLVDLGVAQIDLEHAVATTKSQDLTALLAPVRLSLECVGPAPGFEELRLEVQGNLAIKFRELGSERCPYSASAKVTGTGEVHPEPEDFIVTDGSKVSAGKRSSTISMLPLP